MYLAAQRLVRSRRAAMLAAAPLAAWPTGKRGQADQRRSSAAAQPESVIKMALVCLPLLLLCSTVVAPPAAMVVPWAKPSLHESMEAEARRRFIEMNGLTRPDNRPKRYVGSSGGRGRERP